MMEFSLDGTEFIELKNLLKVTGVCETGGEAKNAIEQAQVSVDGVVETRKGLKLRVNQIVVYKTQEIKVIK